MIPLPWHLEGKLIATTHHTLSDMLSSLEHGHLHVHDLDGLGMLEPIHQFCGLEFGRHQQGAGLVQHLYVFHLFLLLSGRCSPQPSSLPIHDCKRGSHPRGIPLYKPSPVPYRLRSISDKIACGEAT